ncbi:endonuclease III [Fastidiosipila sanguinis]|uniref:Endonuclease III n=1 Tax=Fastidiosipila sanguinis TaxID=236753 RepID=A0A2S0KLY5_9FIRM|nr:endonuclease III [Fastidiosipila sanguinis]AVM42017.1 endonuclease III [Fastidiosipila sanguinis]
MSKAKNKILAANEVQHIVSAMIKLYPQIESELNFNNNFELVCAVVLSAQTTDVAVNKVTPELFSKYPDAESMAAAELEDISRLISSIGLYKNKAKYLKSLSQDLLDKYNSEVPATREELESLAGVGRKTANVVLSNGFDIPAFAVDTHVNRVCKKFNFVPEEASVLEVEEVMCSKLPASIWRRAHHSILLFGRYQCVARKHDHDKCIERIEEVLGE